MGQKFDNAVITEYAKVQATLEALRVTAATLVEQAKLFADAPEFRYSDLDEFGDQRNEVFGILRTLGYDLDRAIGSAKTAIHDDLHAPNYVGMKPCPSGGEYGA